MLKLAALLVMMLPMPTDAQTTNPLAQDEAAIRAARTFSNKSIVRRNLAGVGESLDADFVAIVGDGSFVPSRGAYLKLFKQDFDSPKTAITYERVADTIDVSANKPLAAEHGHWIGTFPDGKVAFTGTYLAMWRHGAAGWKIRSELYVTLVCHDGTPCAPATAVR
jgi:ketosteroid isomerase-like protein